MIHHNQSFDDIDFEKLDNVIAKDAERERHLNSLERRVQCMEVALEILTADNPAAAERIRWAMAARLKQGKESHDNNDRTDD